MSEKHHKYSPSRLEQVRLCPGAVRMQESLPEQSSEYAAEGTLLHEALAKQSADGLNESQLEAFEMCQSYQEELVKENLGGAKVYRELKVKVMDGDELLTEGTADFVIVTPKKLVVVDWKFGWNPVEKAHENIQLASYAVGAMLEFNFHECEVHVFQPRIRKKTKYTFSRPEAIVSNIKRIIAKANQPGLNLVPGQSQCRYCRARLNCPAFRIEYQRLAASKNDYDMADPKVVAALFDSVKTVKPFIDEIEKGLKSFIQRDGKCGRWALEPKAGSRQINDLNALFERVKDFITPREFNSACKITLGKFENLLTEKIIAEMTAKGEKITKKAAKEKCYEIIADLMTRGSSTMQLVEIEELAEVA